MKLMLALLSTIGQPETPWSTPDPQVASSLSCTPRRNCSQIDSCSDAYWYLENCSWGGRLDRDGDGRPCEAMC